MRSGLSNDPERDTARRQLLSRLRRFEDGDSASMEQAAALVSSDAFPSGAGLNTLFDEERWGPLFSPDGYPVDAEGAVVGLVQVLTVGQAYSNSLPPTRVAEARALAADLVAFLGSSASWHLSWRDLSGGDRRSGARIITQLSPRCTFGALVVGRSESDVLVVMALDED